MRKLSIIIAIGVIMAVGCRTKKSGFGLKRIITDTVITYVPDSSWSIPEPGITIDSFLVIANHTVDSLKGVIRSKDSALFESNFKLARVWYYDSLCLKNSRLDKYLKGWIRRALEK